LVPLTRVLQDRVSLLYKQARQHQALVFVIKAIPPVTNSDEVI
jgi:hypothetical protein